MGELIECCLNGCPRDGLAALVDAFVERTGGPLEMALHSDSDASVKTARQAVEYLLAPVPRSCEFRAEELTLGPTLALRSVVLQVFPVGECFDLFLNFREEDASEFCACVEALNAWLLDLQSRFGLGNVYCGMDPAEDLETRFFTNGKPGPLKA